MQMLAVQTHAVNLCLLGKLFNFSKALLSLYSVLVPKRVSNRAAERTTPRERQQTPLQIHHKASSARLRTDYPERISTNYPQRAHYRKPNSCTRRSAFRSTGMSCSSASHCQAKAKETNSVHFSPSLLDLQDIFLTALMQSFHIRPKQHLHHPPPPLFPTATNKI